MKLVCLGRKTVVDRGVTYSFTQVTECRVCEIAGGSTCKDECAYHSPIVAIEKEKERDE